MLGQMAIKPFNRFGFSGESAIHFTTIPKVPIAAPIKGFGVHMYFSSPYKVWDYTAKRRNKRGLELCL